MATGIPLPGQPGEGFLQGINTGSNMFSRIMNSRYNNSLHPSGDVANALYVEQLRNQFGDKHPTYLQAKRAHEMNMAARQSLMDYRGQLSSLAPYRAATPEEKLIAAQKGKGVLQVFGERLGNQNQNQKVEPGMVYGEDGHVISEEEARVYNQALGKKTTDAAIRNKIPYARNVKITMDNIVPEDLVQYSGPQGTAKFYIDSLKAASGTPPEEFMRYQKALTGAKTLSKQLRQFWGDSIQPAATDQINQLTNPSTWSKNPQVAMQQFNQLKQITDQELNTFQQAGTSPFKLDYDKKTNSFFASPSKNSEKIDKIIGVDMGNYPDQGADDQILAVYGPELIKKNPKYTKENLIHTAKINNMSVADLIKQLRSRGP